MSITICRARAADACVSTGVEGVETALSGVNVLMSPWGMTSNPPKTTGGSGDSLASSLSSSMRF